MYTPHPYKSPFQKGRGALQSSSNCSKIPHHFRRREFYEKPTTERKRAKASAVKRHAKKLARENARRTRLY